MMRNFAIEARLAGTLALNGLLHLDGLIAAGRLARSGVMADLGRTLPLEFHSNYYCASAALLEMTSRGAVVGAVHRVKSMRVPEIEAHLVDPGDDGPLSAHYIDATSAYRSKLDSGFTYGRVQACWWTGRGDPEACYEHVREIRHIGAMVRTGYGQVVEWRLHLLDEETEAGLRASDGRPLRAVPVWDWRVLSGDTRLPENAVIGAHCTRPPYWRAAHAIPCVMPTRHSLALTRAEIFDLIGMQ